MARTYSIGRLFVTTTMQGQGAPIFDRGITNEHDGRRRRGQSLVIRAPFTKYRASMRAIVLGIWQRPPTGPGIGPQVGS